MIDIRFLRENPEVVKQNIRNKFQDDKLPLVDEVIELDEALRQNKKRADDLRANRNKLSKSIGALMGQKKFEEAEHAAKFAELLGDVVWDTKTNLDKRMNAESGACADKFRIAKRAKQLDLDAIHDTVHEMAKDEARHGKGFEGLFNRYFKK